MGIRNLAKRLSTSVQELDREALRSYCAEREGTVSIADLVERQYATVVGEISTLRVVPHDGSPWLEAVVSDGTQSLTVMWTGRRAIPGIIPGRRLVVEGRLMPIRPGATKLKLMNPAYELL